MHMKHYYRVKISCLEQRGESAKRIHIITVRCAISSAQLKQREQDQEKRESRRWHAVNIQESSFFRNFVPAIIIYRYEMQKKRVRIFRADRNFSLRLRIFYKTIIISGRANDDVTLFFDKPATRETWEGREDRKRARTGDSKIFALVCAGSYIYIYLYDNRDNNNGSSRLYAFVIFSTCQQEHHIVPWSRSTRKVSYVGFERLEYRHTNALAARRNDTDSSSLNDGGDKFSELSV